MKSVDEHKQGDENTSQGLTKTASVRGRPRDDGVGTPNPVKPTSGKSVSHKWNGGLRHPTKGKTGSASTQRTTGGSAATDSTEGPPVIAGAYNVRIQGTPGYWAAMNTIFPNDPGVQAQQAPAQKTSTRSIASQPDHPDYRYWDSSAAEPVGYWSYPEPGVKVFSEPDGRVTRVWPDTVEMREKYLTK